MVWVYTPTGEIADYVQAIWFANAQFAGESWLPCDGTKGVIFLVSGRLYLAGLAHLEKVNHSLVAPATLTGLAQALDQYANLDSFIDLLSRTSMHQKFTTRRLSTHKN